MPVRTKLAKRLSIAFGSAALSCGSASVALAQQADNPPQELQRVEVTGSSIKRIDAETALPVQIINRDSIEKSGVSTVEQLLQTISAMSSSGGLTTASASGATTGGISAFSIHGLTSLRTLVLINGRRVSPYGIGFTNDSVSVDVNSIPIAAIERVEILKDGASAVYGSDAIAGVVNFILRKDFKGIELTGEYGDTTDGGASLSRGSAVIGLGDFSQDRYNLMVVASVQHENSLFGSQRNFAKSGINVNHLNDLTSGNTFPANIAAVDGSFGSANPSAPTGCLLPYSQIDPLFGSNDFCRFDPSPLVTLVPKSDRLSLFASGRLALNDNWEVFGEASFNQNRIRTVIQPVPLSDQFAIPLTNPLANQYPYNIFGALNPTSAVVLSSTSPFYPTAYVKGITGGATPDIFVRYRAAGAGNRDFTDISEAPRLVLGLRGAALGWDIETSLLYTSSKVREQVNAGYPIYSEFLPLLNNGTLNPFGDNTPEAQAQADAAGFIGDAYTVKTSITSLQAKASRELMQMPAGPLAVAFGGEYRQEKYDFNAAQALQVGDVSGYGGNFLPVNKDRNVSAMFAEVNVPIVKGLEADAAIRYDNYENVGSSTTPKVSLRWQPIPQFLMRASYGKGFRAPSLADLYSGQTQTVTPVVSDPIRCPVTKLEKDCATQYTVLTGGFTGLSPEKSENATLGIVLQPVTDVTLGIDYFKIRLSNTITNGVDSATILNNQTQYASLITRDAPDAAFPTLPGHINSLSQTNINLGGTRVAGFELDGKWAIRAGDWGKFDVSMNGTYFTTFDTQNPDGSWTGGVDQVNASTGGVVPRWKHYLSVAWTRGPWDALIAQNFQKHYHDTAGNFDDPANVRDVSDYITYDAQGSYALNKNWKFTLGVRNLLNTDPPYVNTNAAFQSGYDPQYADPRGRFIYGRIKYSF